MLSQDLQTDQLMWACYGRWTLFHKDFRNVRLQVRSPGVNATI